MIIAFEGLSCSGKSTQIKILKKKHNWSVVQVQINRNMQNPTYQFFIKNDRSKLNQASKLKVDIVLLDRSYLTYSCFLHCNGDTST